jgi:hypothetical protein
MNDCSDCEKAKDSLLSLIRRHVDWQLYDRLKGPSATVEDIIEALAVTLEKMENEIA